MENYSKTIIVPVKKNKRKNSNSKLCIALIAHDGKKAEILSFVKENEEFFKGCGVIATNSTGQLISDHTSISVIRMLSGPLGGDLQIGSLVASGQ